MLNIRLVKPGHQDRKYTIEQLFTVLANIEVNIVKKETFSDYLLSKGSLTGYCEIKDSFSVSSRQLSSP